MTADLRRTFLTLAVAALGAAVAIALGVPAGALLGATIAVTIFALARGGPTVPVALRDVAFAVIGLTLGAGITPSIIQDVAQWPVSLAAMVVTLSIIMAGSTLVLYSVFGLDHRTALLATSPGALSYTLALSAEGRGDTAAVAVAQSVRLLTITLLVPPVLLATSLTPIGGGSFSEMDFLPTLLLLAVAGLAGPLLVRAKVPAAWLLAGFLVSAVAHLAGWVEGRPDMRVLTAGFVVAGATIGARFAGTSLAALRALAGVAVAVSAIGLIGSFLLSWPIALWLGLSHGQVWVAFAPGGVETMAAMAVALGYDPVYVAVHHVVRLLILFAILPLLLR
ncbi:MAG: AbrB family transcriptional regulator [Pseudomonadota bacterium]